MEFRLPVLYSVFVSYVCGTLHFMMLLKVILATLLSFSIPHHPPVSSRKSISIHRPPPPGCHSFSSHPVESFMVCLHLQSVILHCSLWLPSNGMSLTPTGIPKFPNTLIQEGHPPDICLPF